MRISKGKVMLGSATLEVALGEFAKSGERLLLASEKGRIRMYNRGALERAQAKVGKKARLESLARWNSTPVRQLPRSAPAGVRMDVQTALESGRLRNYLHGVKRPLFVLRGKDGIATLVSGSEEFLVATYHCQKHNHPYYPPPAWRPGLRCWCRSEIERED